MMVMRKVSKWQYRDIHQDKPIHKEGTHNIVMMIFQQVHDMQLFDILHGEIPQSSAELLAALSTLS